jgi:hypothetical protein
MSDDFEQAEKTLVALRSKRDALVARGIELAEERQHCAFGAHTGDAAARKKLDAINREAALHDSELRSLDAAIAEAAERVKQAQAVEYAKAERAKAGELKAAIDRMKLAGQTLDDVLIVLVEAGAELHAAVDQIHECGVSHPHHQQVLFAW